MNDRVIDLRSDTATKPTPEMRQAMMDAEVGDDMLGEDPTVNRLEAIMAELLGKEAAVFACSGTQSNQMAIRVHCQPGDELLIEESCHIPNFEAGGPAALSGVMCRTLRGTNGFLDLEQLEGRVHADNQHLSPTRLLSLENTTNLGGGRAYPLEQARRICDWAHENGLNVHVDGARFFNAVVAQGYSPAEFCRSIDTISLCFSKGLGCPMGSILAGSAEQIAKARRARKLFGGALRQAGIVAAAAIYAVENHVERLAEDHQNARTFAELIAEYPQLKINPNDIETNLVFFELDSEWGTGAELCALLGQNGLKIGALGPQLLRACTHLDVSREEILEAGRIMGECLERGSSSNAPAQKTAYANE